MGKSEHTADTARGYAPVSARDQKHHQSARFSGVPKSKGPLPAGWWMVPGALIGICVWGAIAWYFLSTCSSC